MFQHINITNHVKCPDGLLVAGPRGGGLYLSPGEPTEVWAWTVCSEAGLASYCFDTLQQAALAYWVSRSVDRMGPMTATKLVSRAGQRFEELVTNRAALVKACAPGVSVSETQLEQIQKVLVSLGGSLPGVSAGWAACAGTVEGLGHSRERVQMAVTLAATQGLEPTPGNLLASLRKLP